MTDTTSRTGLRHVLVTRFGLRRLLACAALAAVIAAVPVASGSRTSENELPTPTGLKTFLKSIGEERQTSGTGIPEFARTPAFAWTPIRGAKRYEFELSTSPVTGDAGFASANGLVWSSRVLQTPATAIPVALPWITGEPASLYWHVRAVSGNKVSAWSDTQAVQHALGGRAEAAARHAARLCPLDAGRRRHELPGVVGPRGQGHRHDRRTSPTSASSTPSTTTRPGPATSPGASVRSARCTATPRTRCRPSRTARGARSTTRSTRPTRSRPARPSRRSAPSPTSSPTRPSRACTASCRRSCSRATATRTTACTASTSSATATASTSSSAARSPRGRPTRLARRARFSCPATRSGPRRRGSSCSWPTASEGDTYAADTDKVKSSEAAATATVGGGAATGAPRAATPRSWRRARSAARRRRGPRSTSGTATSRAAATTGPSSRFAW